MEIKPFKNKLFAFLFLFLVGTVIGISGITAKFLPQQQTSFAQDLNERKQIVDDFLYSFKLVVDKTGDTQAIKNFNTMKEKSIIVVPDETGFTLLDTFADDPGKIRIVALTSKDAQFPYWKKQLEKSSVAAFDPDPETRLMTLKKTKLFSDFYQGTAVAHESDHARRFLEDPNRTITRDVYITEEVSVYIFQNGLIQKSGGELYRNALIREVENFSRKVKITANGISFPTVVYPDEIDKVFGKPVSTDEKDFRTFLFQVDVTFSYFDKYFTTEKALLYKKAWIESIYQSLDGDSLPKE